MKYISIFFLILLCSCSLIRVKNADVVIKSYRDMPNVFHAMIASKGISILLKEFARSNLYKLHVPTQPLKDSNKNIEPYIHEIYDFNFTLIGYTNLQLKERIGSIDYEAKLTTKGFAVLCSLWIVCLLVVQLRFYYHNHTLSYWYAQGKKQIVLLANDSLYVLFERINSLFIKLEDSRIGKHFLLIFFSLIAFYIFLYIDDIVIREGGAYLGSNDSGDMQWYPSVQLFGLHGMDTSLNPFVETLQGNHFLGNKANYAHLLYVLMYPFAVFEYDNAKILYAIVNNLCILVVFYFLYREMRFRKIPFVYFAIVAVTFFASQTYAMAIFRGNIPLILALFIILSFVYRHNTFICGIALSIVGVKYTFGIPLMLGFFFARFYKPVVFAISIHVLVVAVFANYFHLGFLESLFLPVMVGKEHASSMVIDFLSLAKHTFGGLNGKNPFLYVILCCLIAWIYVILRIKPSQNRIILSSLILSFCLFQHHIYDYTVVICLLFIGMFALRKMEFFILLLYCFYILLYMDAYFYIVSHFFALCYASLLYFCALYILISGNQKELSCYPNKSLL
ncbi:DUF2029 domain-containing protein [Helicobacter aurati]|uniref:DUF2029 domain-containing protein n=1 Tax=Helicobacter aurati TaxID=137778 RepID=A0A3D8J765_9HELI|nr:glycosyltransferase 87 family protein [Helicobacter aurati]RDU73120.1 DUF2029 domain-containing protein [Helicobacter aurati]